MSRRSMLTLAKLRGGAEQAASADAANCAARLNARVMLHEAIRRVIAVAIAGAAALAVAAGLLVFASSKLVDETIAHSHEVDAALGTAAGFVNEWKHTQGRLPTPTEFEAWAANQPDQAYSPKYVQYSREGFSDEVVTEFGSPTGEVFLLTIWRGEWNEYYASWVDRSTLIFNRSEYFLLGSEWLDLAALSAAGSLLAWAAFIAWPPN